MHHRLKIRRSRLGASGVGYWWGVILYDGEMIHRIVAPTHATAIEWGCQWLKHFDEKRREPPC